MEVNAHPLVQLIPILLIFLVMYLVLIRPQLKQQRDLARMQSRLKKNDEVVTAGGLHGKVANVKENVVTLQIADDVRVDVDKTAIVRLIKEG
jgi:preprotein translocase subunit YajC